MLQLPETGKEINAAICSLEKIIITSVGPHQPNAPIQAPIRAPTVATTAAPIPAQTIALIPATKPVTPTAIMPSPIIAPQQAPCSPQNPAPLPTTTTASTNIYPNGTIICKKFSRKYYEGEITGYDFINNFYKIKYCNGDTEEFMPDEITKYQKELQRYNWGRPPHQLEPLVKNATNNNISPAAPRQLTR